jgi:peptidoglycan/LPS O-acetylase OafA/YrhL
MTGTLAIPSPVRERKKSFYRPELDVLRFFAFFGVFLYHFTRPVELYVQHGIPRWIAVSGNALILGGVFGVDLFFALSAFLITELLLREKDKYGALDVRGFYIRRMLRIWPLYFFVIGLSLIPALNPGHEFTWRYAIAFLLLAGNWSIILYGMPGRFAGILWTISIEEQFYLLWPPLVRKLPRNRIGLAAIGILIIATVTRVVIIALHGGVDSVRFNTLARLDPIAAGILLAVALKGNVPNFGLGARLGIICCGIAPLPFIANYWEVNPPVRLEWIPTLATFPVVAMCCTLILLGVLGISIQLPRFLVYLGKISYGLYVYHQLGNFLSGKVIPVHVLFLQLALRPVLALGFTILLASASYAFLEKPFLKLKERFTRVDSRPI